MDDEPDMRVFLTAVVEDNGAEVLEAADGEQAIAMARQHKPHLMTLDLSMPGTDGGAVYAAIRKDAQLKELPICIITGRPELRGTIYDRDVPKPEGYLDKPVSEEGVLTNVRKILELRKSAA